MPGMRTQVPHDLGWGERTNILTVPGLPTTYTSAVNVVIAHTSS
jgi:hypothetical protein